MHAPELATSGSVGKLKKRPAMSLSVCLVATAGSMRATSMRYRSHAVMLTAFDLMLLSHGVEKYRTVERQNVRGSFVLNT